MRHSNKIAMWALSGFAKLTYWDCRAVYCRRLSRAGSIF